MENLRTKLDTLSIEQLFKEVENFIRSANGYDNSLKLVFVLSQIMKESTSLLATIDRDDYEESVRKRIDVVSAECGESLTKFIELERENEENKNHIPMVTEKELREMLEEKRKSIRKQLDEIEDTLKFYMKQGDDSKGKRV